MAKKRKTREDKIRSVQRRVQNSPREADFLGPRYEFVKREFNQVPPGISLQSPLLEKRQNSIQSEFLASTSRDLLKTFIIASMIFTLELVLYFAWKS